MAPADQIGIANSLTQSIAREFAKHVSAGNVPEAWDGFEIRVWLAEKFQREVRGLVASKVNGRTARGIAYKRACYRGGL